MASDSGHTITLSHTAIQAVLDQTLASEEVARRIVALCRRAVNETLQPDVPRSNGPRKETPGLSDFLWSFWSDLVGIAKMDVNLHDRLASIVEVIKHEGTSGCADWTLDGDDFDWNDLPLFGLVARENMNGPARVVKDVRVQVTPTPVSSSALPIPDPAREQWLNMNTFMATLWARGAWNCSFYGITTMRMELEPYSLPPDQRMPGGVSSFEEPDVEVAEIWVRVAGRQMFECRDIFGPRGDPSWNSNAGRPGASGGTWDGVDGYAPERWDHWKSIFHMISKESGKENVNVAAKAAVEAMELVESRKSTGTRHR
ncbi:hypothetical protein BC628DRAFT_1407356 [Trametes gibbosa]|nr:hypothetical protein BC628DRAFT_1407356 [Trametes gibbosa]